MERSDPPIIEARVPSREIAPSVPRGTGFNDVIRNVVFPYALPISDANVSANLVERLATYPNIQALDDKPRKVVEAVDNDEDLIARAAAAAHKTPVSALPQTFSGPRRPPRPSAIPNAVFLSKPTLVTNCPKNRYRTQTVHPLQPSAIHSIVPRASEWANPSGVNMVMSLGRSEKKRRVLRSREGRKGTLPEYSNRLLVTEDSDDKRLPSDSEEAEDRKADGRKDGEPIFAVSSIGIGSRSDWRLDENSKKDGDGVKEDFLQ